MKFPCFENSKNRGKWLRPPVLAREEQVDEHGAGGVERYEHVAELDADVEPLLLHLLEVVVLAVRLKLIFVFLKNIF